MLTRRLVGALVVALLAVAVYASTFIVPYEEFFRARDPLVRTDVARLDPARVDAYAPRREAFAIMQMSNVELSREGQARAASVTQRLVDAAIENGGTYYLTYQLYPTREQLERAHPNARI